MSPQRSSQFAVLAQPLPNLVPRNINPALRVMNAGSARGTGRQRSCASRNATDRCCALFGTCIPGRQVIFYRCLAESLSMRSACSRLCGLTILALTMPAGAENWVVQIPVQAVDGREVMLPLNLSAGIVAKNREAVIVSGTAQNYSRVSLAGSAWSLFPQGDASRKIVFTKRGAQFWTVEHADEDSAY